jgi:hypothetical protein
MMHCHAGFIVGVSIHLLHREDTSRMPVARIFE